LDEHLVEAASYVTDAKGLCRVHFTVSPAHLERFTRHVEEVRQIHEQSLGVSFQVGISIQDPSTDTLAVDMGNRPFREEDGRILLRPGGDGALLKNLQDTGGEIVFIKNIDNVPHGRFLGKIVFWKRLLGGYMLRLREELFQVLEQLEHGPSAWPWSSHRPASF